MTPLIVVLIILLFINITNCYPGEVIWGCSFEKDQIHFTFDDGPDIEYTPSV